MLSLEGQRSCCQLPQADPALPGVPTTWSFLGVLGCYSTGWGSAWCLLPGSGISLQRRCSGWCEGAHHVLMSVRGCVPLPSSPCLWRGWKMGLSARVLIGKERFCQLLPSEPIPSSMSFTLCSHEMGSRTFCSASPPAALCFLCKPEPIQLCLAVSTVVGLPSHCRDAAGSVLLGDVLSPVGVPGCVTLRGPAGAAPSPAGLCSRWHCCFPCELLPRLRFLGAGKGQR